MHLPAAEWFLKESIFHIVVVNTWVGTTAMTLTRDTRTYGHFCMLARALEQLGDRWSLLVVRDLLMAPRRFTDLMNRLGGITPKILTQRLKDLEASDIVHVDRVPGRREVWYSLTNAGRELGPVLSELTAWGFRHNRRPRQPGESLHPEHLLRALSVVLDGTTTRRSPVRWWFRFVDDGAYSLSYDGTSWTVEQGDPPDPDVVVETSSEDWARYLTTPGRVRPHPPPGIEITGSRSAVRSFERALAVFPDDAIRR